MMVILFVFFVIFGIAARADARRRKQLEELRKFEPPNIHGSRRFASEKDLKRGKLI